MNGQFGYALAFATGVFGAFHCLGMCGGIAAGFFTAHGWRRRWSAHLYYHGMRILVYTLFGVGGALIGRVLVQTGWIGKGQGLLMMLAGLLIMFIGLMLTGWLPGRRAAALDAGQVARVDAPGPWRRPWAPALAGLFNGLMPCSLVFSVAVKAVVGMHPVQAGLLMLAFGLGTLPTMGALTLLGAWVGQRARAWGARLAAVAVIALGAWTLYQGAVFYDIMRGLSNW